MIINFVVKTKKAHPKRAVLREAGEVCWCSDKMTR